MYRILFSAIFCILLTKGTCQQSHSINKKASIIGRIIDSVQKNPLEYATITLLSVETQKVVDGGMTDKMGQFEIAEVDPGNYILLVEFIGYRAYRKKIPAIRKNAILDLKTITLSLGRSVLSTVIVTSPQKLIESKIDKIVFNAEKDITSQGGVATDLLKKIPQVSVDADGNVELSGSSSIRFLINGKPSTAFGSNIADVLQSIPASQIKSIEVITNPGAKYDAQGLGGIINIILKQNTARGVNGNVSLTAGTRLENGAFNFNARKNNFGFNAFITGNTRLTATTPGESLRSSFDSSSNTNVFLHQDTRYKVKRHGLESGIGFDWNYKKYNTFSGSLTYNNFGNEATGFIMQSQKITNQAGTVLSDIISQNKASSAFRFHSIDLNVNYKRKFSKEDQELEISYNGSFGNNHITAASEQFLMPQDSLYYGINSINPGTSNETEIRADYSQPLQKDILLGLGGKITLMDIMSTADIYSLQPDANKFLFDGGLSNYLKYHQQVYALYTEIGLPVKNLIDLKVGVRYERTETSSYYSNATQQASAPGYNTVVPSIFISRKISDNQTIRLSYSKRIERPDYGDLNPFINTSDPKNVTAGNPYLKPEIGNRFELSYSRDFDALGSLMITAFYRNNRYDIQPYIIYYPSLTIGDSIYTNISVSTRENIGNENNTGLNIFGDFHANKKFNLRSNLFLFHRHTINKIEQGRNSNSFNYRVNVNTSYQFSNVFSVEFFANFNSPRHEAQGKYPSFTSYNFAIRRQFWNKKGSLAITATNPFNKYTNQRTILTGKAFDVITVRRIPFRSFGINFTWKFGKLEFKKDNGDKEIVPQENQ